jgi:acyl carrier protein
MVPSAFVPLDKIPLTANGKVDRKALPALNPGRPNLTSTFQAPRDELEDNLAAIWLEVLHLPRVGIHDDFFELGGHSLIAMQIVARIRTAYETRFTIKDFFANPTIAGEAEAIQARILAEIEQMDDAEVKRFLSGL